MIIKKLQTTYAFSYLYTKIKMISNIQLIPMNDAKFGIKNKALVCNLWLKDVCCHLKKNVITFLETFCF